MPIKRVPIIEVETIDIKELNPVYSDDEDEDNSGYTKYCPVCRSRFQWVELIKTAYGWWTCPKCDYRGYG